MVQEFVPGGTGLYSSSNVYRAICDMVGRILRRTVYSIGLLQGVALRRPTSVADDGVAHCRTEEEAKALLKALTERFKACGLELHPEKTNIVYCKDQKRKGDYPNTSFDYLGYTFQPRMVKNQKQNSLFVSFTPAVSQASLKAMRREIRAMKIKGRTDLSLNDLARMLNPKLVGWLNYYGRYNRSKLYSLWRYINVMLIRWLKRKYKKLGRYWKRGMRLLEEIWKRDPKLFVHWRHGMKGAFA